MAYNRQAQATIKAGKKSTTPGKPNPYAGVTHTGGAPSSTPVARGKIASPRPKARSSGGLKFYAKGKK